MPEHYSQTVLSIIGLIFALTTVYFIYTQPIEISEEVDVQTNYQERPVYGALQPLPLITQINQDWVLLGKALFDSTLLSSDNTVSCSSCHIVSKGGTDNFPKSVGVNSKLGDRNSPTVLNASLNFRQFWDGRSITLSEQISGPIHNPVEMASSFPQIIDKLKRAPVFNKAFNALNSNGITKENIIKAITLYEESLITYNSPIDNYLLGDDSALNEQQIRGLDKFKQYGCITCHQGRNIGGNLFQKLGRLDKAPTHLLEDKGLFNITKLEKDKHVFKVPSLRNVALTAPYFHDGSITTLNDAVKLMGRMQLGIELSEDDINDIVALLHSFTGEIKEQGTSQ
ncbi:MAG: cytochrome-c peroxidase [Kangiellaceae bacterium]